MADEADMTADRMEAEEARRRKLFKAEVIPDGTGECQWCGKTVEGVGRWCGPGCRDDEQKTKR